jgi:DNA-binding response OmpR family regulator
VLYDRAGALDGRGGATTIKSHIANLRRKLRDAGCSREFILNVYGLGYRLADD